MRQSLLVLGLIAISFLFLGTDASASGTTIDDSYLILQVPIERVEFQNLALISALQFLET